MSTLSATEVFQLTEEYKRIESEWHVHKNMFDWIVAKYADANGDVGEVKVKMLIVDGVGRTNHIEVHAQALLSDLQLQMNIIDLRKQKLDPLVVDANSIIDYPPA